MAFDDVKVVLTGPWVSFRERVITQSEVDRSGVATAFSRALCSPPLMYFCPYGVIAMTLALTWLHALNLQN